MLGRLHLERRRELPEVVQGGEDDEHLTHGVRVAQPEQRARPGEDSGADVEQRIDARRDVRQ